MTRFVLGLLILVKRRIDIPTHNYLGPFPVKLGNEDDLDIAKLSAGVTFGDAGEIYLARFSLR